MIWHHFGFTGCSSLFEAYLAHMGYNTRSVRARENRLLFDQSVSGMRKPRIELIEGRSVDRTRTWRISEEKKGQYIIEIETAHIEASASTLQIFGFVPTDGLLKHPSAPSIKLVQGRPTAWHIGLEFESLRDIWRFHDALPDDNPLRTAFLKCKKATLPKLKAQPENDPPSGLMTITAVDDFTAEFVYGQYGLASHGYQIQPARDNGSGYGTGGKGEAKLRSRH